MQTKNGTSTYNWSGKNVLIAEDEDSNYFLIKAYLKNTGMNILRAKTGEQVMSYIEDSNQPISIVLMDIKMPVMNGADATKLIKDKYNIPVIAQTAYATSYEMETYKKAGFDAYLTKPLSKRLLLETIRTLL